jgi:hypothetical protein
MQNKFFIKLRGESCKAWNKYSIRTQRTVMNVSLFSEAISTWDLFPKCFYFLWRKAVRLKWSSPFNRRNCGHSNFQYPTMTHTISLLCPLVIISQVSPPAWPKRSVMRVSFRCCSSSFIRSCVVCIYPLKARYNMEQRNKVFSMFIRCSLSQLISNRFPSFCT